MRKKLKKTLITDLLILVIIAIALAVSMAWSQDIELKLGLLYSVEASTVDPSDIVEIKTKQTPSGVTVTADGETDAAAGSSAPALYLHYLDVGQADCTIIEFPDGKTMVIDGGENNKKTEAAIKTFIDNTLPDDFKYFDYAILTHPDSDHCGSMDYVLNNYPARFVYRPNVEAVGTNSNPYTDPGKADLTVDAVTKNTAAYANAVRAMYQTTPDFTSVVYITDPADEQQSIAGGDGDDAYTFMFFSPLSDKYTDWNDYSPIMLLNYRGYNFALSGDAEHKNEEEFVARVDAAKTDGITDKYDIFTDEFTVNAIKCGHHGSRTSTSQAYIDAITTPDGAKNAYYIISCGTGNSYGHPHSETLDRLDAMGVPDANVMRTDIVGDITLSVRVDSATGEYALYNGDKPTQPTTPSEPDTPDNPDKPDTPDTPDNPDTPEIPEEPSEPEEQKTYVYVYRTLGGIKLKWAVVAWTCYAALVIVAAAHIAIMSSGGKEKGRK